MERNDSGELLLYSKGTPIPSVPSTFTIYRSRSVFVGVVLSVDLLPNLRQNRLRFRRHRPIGGEFEVLVVGVRGARGSDDLLRLWVDGGFGNERLSLQIIRNRSVRIRGDGLIRGCD